MNYEGSIVSNFSERISFIWTVADLLRGPYKPAQYGKVILPLTVLRRLDCVLEPTKQKVLEKAAALRASGIKDVEPILNRAAGQKFHNTSKLDFQKLKGDPDKVATNLAFYIKHFSSKARQNFEYFKFEEEIAKLPRPTGFTWSSRSSPRSTSTRLSFPITKWA
jgi:type I restriction enzyme M protein